MKNLLVVLSAAVADMHAAKEWYNQCSQGLGDQFVIQLDIVLERILHNPGQFAAVDLGFQRAMVRRFPYAVYFRVETTRVAVYGVLHHRQDAIPFAQRQ